MALSEENGGMVMPVAPMYGGGYGYGNGFGFGGDATWLIILFLFAFMGNGFGGFGGFGGMNYDFPWLLNGQNGINNNVNNGFDHAATQSALAGIQTSLTNGFSSAEVAACNRAMNAQATEYNNQIASMNQNFANQQALDTRLDTIAANQQTCCCKQDANAADLKYTISTEASATRQANAANTQMVMDKLCQLELDGYKTQLAQSQAENVALRTQANLNAQTAQLIADNTAQTQYVVNRVAPYPVPSYTVPNPFGCNGYNGGYNFGFNG